MFLTNRTSQRRRATLVTVIVVLFLASLVVQRTTPASGFYDWIERHPVACLIVRPFFVLAGRGVEFDSQIQWAAFGRMMSEMTGRDAGEQIFLCLSHPSDDSKLTN